ncbi:hypothetical protein OGH69_16335 [Flavobacterium sp. MFBS3-15]|uniref:hypothetical protein n=1 Tax=Flavobacterium sp. MFBS3-15 TaxID=2989816 RepID=UPI002235E897|nr:hypothetical protein [Flavobacterium sp. MFBS3-15]MCW4470540.1 hypothetical protein [Flavobacterium sp. MFBS3-15]
MKHNFFIAMAFCLATTFAFAQKISSKDIQGHWKIAAFSASGIQYELATQQIVLSEEMKALVNEEAMEGMKAGMQEAAGQFDGGFVDFDATTMKMGMAGTSETNGYSLTEKDGKQYLSLKMEDGSIQEMPVVYQDKRLHVMVDTTQNFSMIFTKG